MFRGGQFQSSANSLRGDVVVRVAAGTTVVVADVPMVVAAMAVVVLETTMAPPSKEDSAKSLVRSARGPTMKPLIVGTAMTMKMSTNTRLQELLPLDMGSTPTSMQTVVHPITLPVNSRR
jgi:hypothetical protein